MRNVVLSVMVFAGLSGVADVVRAQDADRPAPSVLRFSEDALLARFTEEVRKDHGLEQRALALWRTHFAAQAADLARRFASEDDWRPALADAAALVDEFLEASDLPRAGHEAAGAGQVWVERLDQRTGRRLRELRPAPEAPPIFAPRNGETPAPDKKRAPGKAERAAPPAGR